MDAPQDTKLSLFAIAGQMMTAQIKGTTIESEGLQQSIQTFYRALQAVYDGVQNHLLSGPLNPAVSIDDSVQDDYIVCLEDGKKFQMLKRHLLSTYNMTPEQYRERWNLPQNYPMTAPNYAEKRSAIAKRIGLGITKKRKHAVV